MRNELNSLLAKKEFADLSECAPDVFKFNYKQAQNNISTIYIDYSNQLNNDVEQSILKQRRILEADYYKSEGSLQWNYYYYFVLDKENFENYKDSEIIKKIEADPSFSRKRVVNIESLKKSYPFSSIFNISQHSNRNVSDLSSEWIKILKKNDLDEIYSEDKSITFGAAIERYLVGQPQKDNDAEGDLDNALEVSSPDGIKKITLEKYRSFPEKSFYDFSDVNLIEGENGKGKTSLLEAIELVMCGKTYRHEGLKAIEPASIEIVYKGTNAAEAYDPKNTKKFQQKDLFWYGIPATHHQNNLYKSFNRFNFFNTDASYRFSMESESQAIWNSFISLALGGKTAELGKRMEGFSTRFIEIEKKLSKEVEASLTEINNLQVSKEAIAKQSKSRSFDDAETKKTLKYLGSALEFNKDNEEDLNSVILFLEKVKRNIRVVEDIFPNSKDINLEKIKNKLAEMDVLSDSLTKAIGEVNFIEGENKKIGEKIKFSNLELDKVKKLKEYAFHDDALGIANLEYDLLKKKNVIIKVQDILKNIGPTDMMPTSDDSILLKNKIKVTQEAIDALSQQSKSLDIKIREEKSKIESVKSVLLEIKSLGRTFLSVSDSGQCPMCETVLERSDLEQKISQVQLVTDNFTSFLETKAAVDFDIKVKSEFLGVAKRLLTAIQELSLPDFNLESALLSEIKLKIKEEFDRLKIEIEACEQIQKKIELLKTQGFSTEEFSLLLIDFDLVFEGDKEAFRESVELKYADINSKYVELQENVKNLNRELQQVKESFYQIYPNLASFDFSTSKQKDVFNEIARVKSVQIAFDFFLNEVKSLPQNESLNKLGQIVVAQVENLNDYLSFLSKLKQETLNIQQLENQIMQKTKAIEASTFRLHQARKAVAAFEEIDRSFGRDQAVERFFSQNKEVILQIFKVIHLPNEFDDIVLSDKNIYVVKNGVQRELSTISTGQRTAVALSIFFGMHLSCVRAPKIILLDDPIAFIDDLNVLAFLDFLRELVVKGGRQIFFATANKKLANLFRRKFDLLNSTFDSITPNARP